jgi:hypothetical protein
MPSKPRPHAERYPDFGISKKDIPYGSFPKRLLYYARFRMEQFTWEEYRDFRGDAERVKDSFTRAVKKLVSMGFVVVSGDGFIITPDGMQAVRSIGARDSLRADRTHGKEVD